MIIIKQQQENGARRCLVPQRSKGRVHSGQLWCSKKELKKKKQEKWKTKECQNVNAHNQRKKGVAALEEKAEKRGKSQLATIVPMG